MLENVEKSFVKLVKHYFRKIQADFRQTSVEAPEEL